MSYFRKMDVQHKTSARERLRDMLIDQFIVGLHVGLLIQLAELLETDIA